MAQAWKAACHCAVWQWQKYSAEDHGRRLHFHIMQHEMNVTNRCITNQRRLILRRHREKKKNKKPRKQNGAGQWLVVISPQISRQHISPRCTQSSSPSDSALTCTCMLMPLSPICQSAHSLMGKKTVLQSTTAMQKVTAMALVKRLTAKPRQLLPTTRVPVDFLDPCFTASRCKNDISGIEAATRRL